VRRSVYCFDTGRFAEGLAVTQDAEQKLHGRISEFDEARLLLEMGATLRALGRIDEAQARLTTALERFRDTSPLKHGNTAYWLCICALDRNDLDAAERWSQIAMDATAATGHRRGHAMSLWTRAEIAHKRGDRIGAVELIEQALAEAREIGSVWIQREVLEALIARLREYGCAENADRRQGELDALGRG
jgi:tetratricopeptide (TPR) repeat protein